MYFPSAAALAMPSLWRSNIRSRSNVATPQHGQHQLAGRASGVDALPAHRKHDQGNAPLFHLLDNVQQVAGGPGEPVGLGHHQHVTLAHEFEGRGQLGAVYDG